MLPATAAMRHRAPVTARSAPGDISRAPVTDFHIIIYTRGLITENTNMTGTHNTNKQTELKKFS